ncbi:GAF sensor signal transduction histidine kinase [Psychroflexus salarius]|uniref:histidine kinase n=1 Tax=Psychroflexus salarius TaxID=1155689 RepID=A0A1M4W8C2_9FLAO|nr:GAF domain-containing sensor histidine kinase [Psychroflexus salarius]SHE77508.1 GAF sensor signal transduction histidine kinase [Psychroflexus salarius]
MKPIPKPTNETKRLQALKSLQILDSKQEKEYDDLAKLASTICDTPIALVSLVDEKRQWFKAKVGLDLCEVDREYSFCSVAIQEPTEILEIHDAREDERFKNNPYTFGENAIVFYAGVPLIDKNENALGTLCVIGHEPRILTDSQKTSLKRLANQVVKLFELRAINEGLRKTQRELRENNNQLKNFAGVVSHDMKMPLANMIITFDILKSKYADKLDQSGLDYINNLKQSAFKMSDYISNILLHYESDKITSESEANQVFDVHQLLEDIEEMLDAKDDYEINFPDTNKDIYANRIALEQILLNLVGNSIKYNDKDKIKINISFSEDATHYHFVVTDNGIGIPEDQQKKVFELFSTVAEKDRNGHSGNGIGLSTVRKLIYNLGGTIQVKSEVNKGTSIHFTIEKND